MPFLTLPRLRFKRSKNKVEIEPEEVKVEKEDVLEINVLNLTRKPSVNRSRVSTVHKGGCELDEGHNMNIIVSVYNAYILVYIPTV